MPFAGLRYLLVLGLVAARPNQLRGNSSEALRVNQFVSNDPKDLDHMYCQFFQANHSSTQQQHPQVLVDAQLAVERLQLSRMALSEAFDKLNQGRQRAKDLTKQRGQKLENHAQAEEDLAESEAKLAAFSQALVSLDEKVKAEEALVSKTSTELCDRKAMLVAQRKLIEEKEKEIAAKEKLYDNAWEDLEAGVWGRESSQAKVKEMQKENNASKQELNRKQAAIAATSADLEERRKKIEEGRRLIASARNQMTTLKGAVDREEKIVEKEEATLNFLSKALSQQSEMNKGYQGALMNAQSELHMSYHSAVDKQGKAIDHLKGVHSGIAETMGLQDAAMQSVQQAISETKRALAWCSDESLKEYLQDRAKNFDQKLKDFNEVQPPPQQNPNQIVANRLKEKIDELVKALPKDSPYKSF